MVQSYIGVWLGRQVVPVRYRPIPARLERRYAHLDLGRILGNLPALRRDLALVGEAIPEHQVVVEYPEVLTGEQEIRGAAPGQPPAVLTGRDVGEPNVVLPPNALADWL